MSPWFVVLETSSGSFRFAVDLLFDGEGLIEAVNTSTDKNIFLMIKLKQKVHLGMWRMRKVTVVKMRITARLCSLSCLAAFL